MGDKLRIYNVKWTSFNAGPSPEGNARTEVFLSGCKMAMEGHPCKGCFNPKLWDFNVWVAEESPEDAAKKIMQCGNKYITFVGGEPFDQLPALTATCKILHDNGFHIIVFTHYILSDIVNSDNKDKYASLFSNIDVLIDGKYDENQRIYDDSIDDGFHNAVGSGNQIVWDVKSFSEGNPLEGFFSRDITALYVSPDHHLTYIFNNPLEEVNKCMVTLPRQHTFEALRVKYLAI